MAMGDFGGIVDRLLFKIDREVIMDMMIGFIGHFNFFFISSVFCTFGRVGG